MTELLTERTARVVAARKLPRRAGRDGAGRFLAEGRAGRPRGARRPATVHELFATATAAAAPPRAGRGRARGRRPGPPVTDRAAAALSETVTPQGLVAVCALLDVPAESRSPRRPRLVAVLVERRRPGQRRHRAPHGRRRGRRRRGARRATPPTRTTARRCARRAGSLFHVRVARDRDARPPCSRPAAPPGSPCWPPTARASWTSTTLGAAAVLAGPTLWLFGNEAHGLPAELAAAGRRTGADPDPRPGREPQPRHGRRGLPLRERAGVTHRLSAGGSAAPPRRPAAAGSAPLPRARTPTAPSTR